MTRPMVREHNSQTDIVTDREMNDAEFAQYTAQQLANVASQAAAVIAANTKASGVAKLLALGLTLPEIAALP